MNNFSELLEKVKSYPLKTVAVAAAQDHTIIEAVIRSSRDSIAEPILVGDEREIRRIAEEHELDLGGASIVNRDDDIQAARTAVELVKDGEADLVMKGYIHTDDFLRAVLNRERGLRAGVIMSHVFVLEMDSRDRFLFVTDGAMNMAPDLEHKAEIVLNAVHLAHVLGFEEPRVAALAAVELLNPAMQATVDATCLQTMGARRQFSPRCLVDGPFALDNAISELAARHKKIEGPVAGNADVLLVPDIEAGNILVKALVHLAGARVAGVVVGAKRPVVLTSRADSAEAKYLSIALGVYLTTIERRLKLKIGKVHY